MLIIIEHLWCQNIKSIYSLYESSERGKHRSIYTVCHHLVLLLYRLDLHIVVIYNIWVATGKKAVMCCGDDTL